MKRLLQLLVVSCTFYIGMIYFPEYIFINSMQTMIITSVLMVIFNSFIALVLDLIIKSMQNMVDNQEMSIGGVLGCLSLFIIIPTAILNTPIRLWILEGIFDGFKINGFWTYILLSILFVVFSIKKSENKK